MSATWLASLVMHDASIVDPIWGLGFVLIAWAVRITVDGNTTRQWVLVALVTVWGLRLSIYLAWRRRAAAHPHPRSPLKRVEPEKSLVKRRPGYAEYVARTSPFIPRPPRRTAQGDPNWSAGTVLKAGNEGRDPCVAPPDTRTSQGD